MASQSDMVEMMTHIEVALTQQASVIASLNRRIDEGDQNIEQRFTASEERMADALAAMGNALSAVGIDPVTDRGQPPGRDCSGHDGPGNRHAAADGPSPCRGSAERRSSTAAQLK